MLKPGHQSVKLHSRPETHYQSSRTAKPPEHAVKLTGIGILDT